MRHMQVLPGLLALGSLLLAAIGEALSLLHLAGWLGIALFALALPTAVAAWVTLGAPFNRRALAAKRLD